MEELGLVVLFLFGAAFVAIFLPAFFLSIRSRSWTAVDGEVVSTWISTHESSHDSLTYYSPQVRYKYSFGGRSYTSERRAVVDTSERHDGHAKNILERYRPGTRVTVYVDPMQPREALLENGISFAPLLAALFGVGCMLFAVFMLVR